MYQIFFNDLPIYDPRDSTLYIRQPHCHLAVGEAGTLAFTIDPGHPYAGRLSKLSGVLSLKADGQTIYRGRIRKDTRDFNLSRRIESEGLLACLNDSLVSPFTFPDDFMDDAGYETAAASGNVIKYFLSWLLDRHNSQVGTEQRIELGEVTVTDPNNYISRASSEYLTTMEAVKKKLVDLLGGHLLADYSGETTKLHYYSTLPLTNTQSVEYGENLLDLVTETDAAETYTAILPLGQDGLTIAELPDGEITPGYIKAGHIIYSQNTEELYGGVRVTRKAEWPDVTEAQNLQTKALALLSTDGVKLAQTITVKAVDLGGEGAISRFVVGRNVKLQSTPHGFSATYPLMELDPDILDPGNTDITMGATIKAASDIAQATQSANQEKLDRHQLQLNQQQSNMTEMAQTTQEQITNAIQTSEKIILEALDKYVQTSNFEEFQKTVTSQFELMSNQIALRFNETTETITNVNGDLQVVLTNLSKHFEFSIDGLGIRGGEKAMQLELDNDLVLFKKNGQQFGWWDGVNFHTGNIVIEVNERAQFGNFAYVPRSNGSLSFLKVGG